MDQSKNIGLAYNLSSSSEHPSLRYTGRLVDDRGAHANVLRRNVKLLCKQLLCAKTNPSVWIGQRLDCR